MRCLSRLEINRFLSEEAKMASAGRAAPGRQNNAGQASPCRGVGGRILFQLRDIESHRKAIIRDPEDFWHISGNLARAGKQRIGLDEIHKYPRWKRFLKGLYDAGPTSLEVMVTGSGRLDIYQRGGDSLFGRYHLYPPAPFTLGEYIRESRQTVCAPDEYWRKVLNDKTPAAAKKGLEDLEALTGFPEPLFSGSATRLRRWRRSHQTSVVREDLRDLTRIREIGLVETLAALLPDRDRVALVREFPERGFGN
ncbi:MAG: AAA family ATPase [Desulfobacterales bacterium]|nr:AAA family ATPase [Desulfobacterales bacterium]